MTICSLATHMRAATGIALPNAASVGLHVSMGFQPIGIYRAVGYKLGRWHDVGWYQLALQEPVIDPGPPKAFSHLCGTLKLEAALLTAEA